MKKVVNWLLFKYVVIMCWSMSLGMRALCKINGVDSNKQPESKYNDLIQDLEKHFAKTDVGEFETYSFMSAGKAGKGAMDIAEDKQSGAFGSVSLEDLEKTIGKNPITTADDIYNQNSDLMDMNELESALNNSEKVSKVK